jgi:hypothetical protein
MWNWLLTQRLSSRDPAALRKTLSELATSGSLANVAPILESVYAVRLRLDDREASALLRDALAGCARTRPTALLDYLIDDGLQAALLLDAYFMVDGPPEPVAARIRDETRSFPFRKTLIEATWRLGQAKNFEKLYREWREHKEPTAREMALEGLHAADVPDTEALLVEGLQSAQSRSERFTAARLLRERGWQVPTPELSAWLAVTLDGVAGVETGGAFALPVLLSALSFGDEATPSDLERLADVLQRHAPEVPDALLAVLASLKDPTYHSREFGSGHRDTGFGLADASKVRTLAHQELARREA